jgi:hypothetical protein
VCLQAIFQSYFADFFFFPLVFLGTILASNFILAIFYLNLCLSQNQRALHAHNQSPLVGWIKLCQNPNPKPQTHHGKDDGTASVCRNTSLPLENCWLSTDAVVSYSVPLR